MKNRVKSWSGLMALGLFAVATATQSGVTLRRTLVEGQKDVYISTYKVGQKMNMEAMGMGEQDMTVDGSMRMTYTIGKVDGDKADLTIEVSDLKMEFGGAMAAAASMMGELPTSYTVKGKVDRLNRFSEFKVEGLNSSQAMMTGADQQAAMMNVISFPEGPVSVGDSWKMPLPKIPMFGNRDVALDASLVSVKTVNGKEVAEIRYSGTIPMEMQMSAEEAGGMQMTMKATMQVEGTVLVEIASGRILSAEGKGDGDAKMEMVDMGASFQVKSTVSSTMKLVE